MKKRLLYFMGCFILTTGIIYLLVSFMYLSIDPEKWGEVARSGFAIIGVPTAAFISLLMITEVR